MMTASIIILPVIRVETVDEGIRMHVVRVPITPAALKRLRARAADWSISIEDAASGLLDQALAPPKRRGK